MKYIIDRVSLCSNSDTTEKEALLQSVAKHFEHYVLGGGDALLCLLKYLRGLVKLANKRYGGDEIKVYLLDGEIFASKGDALYIHIFTLSYAPIKYDLFGSHIRGLIKETVMAKDQELAKAFIEMQLNSSHEEEGGEL